MQRTLASAAFAAGIGLATTSCGPAHNDPTHDVDPKFGGSTVVKMTVLAAGNLEPMSAIVRQAGPKTLTVQITEGGSSPAKNVEIDRGSCPKPDGVAVHLPPFRGNEYQASVSSTQLATLESSPHALAVWSSDGARRSIYACGDVRKPAI